MKTFLIGFFTAVGIAGYAVQPPPETMEYHVTAQRGDTVWGICSGIVSNQDDIREVVYNAMKDSGIEKAGKLMAGTEVIVKVRKMD